MRTVFIDLMFTHYDRITIYQLSACLKNNNIDVDYINEIPSNEKKILKKLLVGNYDLIMYTSFSGELGNYYKLDYFLKKNGISVPSIIGGPGPTFEPEDVLKNSTIDYVCIGEGETALVKFIESGFTANKNIVNRKTILIRDFYPLVDLNSLPFPDRSVVYDLDKARRLIPYRWVMAGKGCPYNCTYCHNELYKNIFKDRGTICRLKNVDYLLDEIENFSKKYLTTNIVFKDDTFVYNKKWITEFCEKYPKRFNKLPFGCNSRPELLNQEMASMLKEAGCTHVEMAIESGDENYRKTVLGRQMSDQQIIDAGYWADHYKISTRITNMVGLPGETIDQINKTIDLNIKAKGKISLAYIFQPFPGTKIYDYSISNGFYKANEKKELQTRGRVSKLSSNIKEKELINISCLFGLFVDFPSLFRSRFIYSLLMLLPTCFLNLFLNTYYAFQHFIMLKLWKLRFFVLYSLAKRHFFGENSLE